MRTLKHPQVGDIELERVLYALSDPVRPGIVRQLDREGEATCRGVNGPCISTSFLILRFVI
jgi:hypothetical protein